MDEYVEPAASYRQLSLRLPGIQWRRQLGRQTAETAYTDGLVSAWPHGDKPVVCKQLSLVPPRPAAKRPSHHGPLNPQHRSWHDFAADMQALEAIARREHLRLTKNNVCQFGADSTKTITRTMRRYGLEPTDWPPSRWTS